MPDEKNNYTIFPISDSALVIDFGNRIDESINAKVLALFRDFQTNLPEGIIETVPAYSSLAVYYDVFQLSKTTAAGMTAFDLVKEKLEEKLRGQSTINSEISTVIDIPVCYDDEYAPDIETLATKKGLSTEDVVRIHTSKDYRVFMLGFLPGFSYMGGVDDRIAIARKMQPVPVAAGSVGIAGHQTGIYPLASPGGWHIIGRTPLKLFDEGKDRPTLLKAGDVVRFVRINKNEFTSY